MLIEKITKFGEKNNDVMLRYYFVFYFISSLLFKSITTLLHIKIITFVSKITIRVDHYSLA